MWVKSLVLCILAIVHSENAQECMASSKGYFKSCMLNEVQKLKRTGNIRGKNHSKPFNRFIHKFN